MAGVIISIISTRTFEGGKQIQDLGLMSKLLRLVFNKHLQWELQLKVQSNINLSDLHVTK